MRDEAWKYTSLRPLAENEFREPLTSVDGGELPGVPGIDGPALVFVDGRLRDDLSEPRPRELHPLRRRAGFGALSRRSGSRSSR